MLPELRKNMALRLRALREERGMSLQDVADVIGMTKGAIRFYEAAEREPNFDTLEKLAILFNTTPWHLLLSVEEADEVQRALDILGRLPDEQRRKVLEYAEEQLLVAGIRMRSSDVSR